jgi:hypothetical protein
MAIFDGHYPLNAAYDELIGPDGEPRPAARQLFNYLSSLDADTLEARRRAIDAAIMTMGITFTVYSDGANIDRAWPFDLIPRIMDRREWERIDAGLKQRLTALNLFIDDLYNQQRVVKDGVFPLEVLAGSKNFRTHCRGITPRFGVWAHICGTDLVRDRDGTVYVLEDNLRVPSGVSYMLENRKIMKRIFPEMFQASTILPVDDYPTQLYDTLAALSPREGERPVVVVLTPGIFNSAYFEHSYLAQQMGAFLVEGSDLVVRDDDCVYMKTISGLRRVDVIYRRIDDDFLDPEVFRPDSILGVAGLMRAWRAGKVGIANAPGAGVADDKVVYGLRAQDHQVLPGPGPHPPQRAQLAVHVRGRARVCPRQPRQAGGEARQRVGGVRHDHRTARDGGGAGQVCPAHPRKPAQLHGPADARHLHRPYPGGRPPRPPSPGPAPLRAAVEPPLRHHRRTHPRGHARGLPGGQLLAGRRQQGHLDRGAGVRLQVTGNSKGMEYLMSESRNP